MRSISPIEQCPIAVIGGGPTGLACAIALAQAGEQVIVLERGSWPRDKICGEGLMPSGVDVLDRLGVLPLIASDQCRPFRGIGWIDPQGHRVSGDFASGQGLAIRRTGLSAALVQRARELEGITLWERACVDDMTLQPEGMRLSVTHGGRSRMVMARVVIGADGRNSPTRKRAGLCGQPPVRARRWGARQHFTATPWSDRVEVWWADGVEAYITPSSDSRVEVAFLWDEADFEPPDKGPRLVTSMLSHFPELRARLAGGLDSPTSVAAAIGPLAVAASGCTADRVILVGDAVGYVDGITGEGITAGLLQAEAVAAHLPALLRKDQLYAVGMRALGRRVQRIFDETVPLARGALLLSRYRRLRTAVFRGLKAAPRLFTALLELNMGRAALRHLSVSSLVRFIGGVLWPAVPVSTAQERAPQLMSSCTTETSGIRHG